MINMDLESTIVTINNLLKLDFESSFSDFIQSQKQLMAIPDYQREYKWEKSKIKTFVDNVMQRSKFLGIITVEAPISNFLSLVDGNLILKSINFRLCFLNFLKSRNVRFFSLGQFHPGRCIFFLNKLL